jgi:O-acetylserine/cysteine efflux transporter
LERPFWLAETLARPVPLDRAGLGCLFSSVLFLSSAWPLTKLAVMRGTTPLWFAESRAALSGLVALLLVVAAGRLRVPARQDLPALFVVGVFQLALFFIFSHIAVAFVPAGRTAVLANTTTYFVVPLSVLVLGEPIPPRRWLAAALGIAGVAVLMGPWAIDWTQRNVLIGNGFLLLAGLSFAIAIVVVRARPPRSPMFTLLPWCFGLAALLILPLVGFEAPHGTFGHHPVSWVGILYVGLIAGPLGTWGVTEATMRLPSMVSSVGFLATPAIGLVLSNLVLGEPFTPDLVGGSALILAGVALSALPARR